MYQNQQHDVVNIGKENLGEPLIDCICFGNYFESEHEYCRVLPLAGKGVEGWSSRNGFGLSLGSGFNKVDMIYWSVFLSAKQDLLMYMDMPINAEKITKILNGTLEILESV
jgi:hypothetical protein